MIGAMGFFMPNTKAGSSYRLTAMRVLGEDCGAYREHVGVIRGWLLGRDLWALTVLFPARNEQPQDNA